MVETAIDRLVELGILDDAAFARAWVESRDRAHPRGGRALRQELRAKGIADDVIAQVLDERSDGSGDAAGPTDRDAAPVDPDEVAAARLLERKASFLGRTRDPRERRQRAYVLLVRNGFDHELAWRLSAGVAVEPPSGTPDAASEAP